VEGYFDAVRLAAAGVESVVAPLGTAMTAEQAQLLVRYSKNIYLLYDSDQAGLKATFRSGDELLAEGATVRVVSLPDGDDPDSFVQKRGGDALERQVKDAIDVFERKIQLLERGGWFADLTRRRSAVDRLLPTIWATRDPVMRDIYLARRARSRTWGATLQREVEEGGSGATLGGAPRRHARRASSVRSSGLMTARAAAARGGGRAAGGMSGPPSRSGGDRRDLARKRPIERPPRVTERRIVAVAAERYLVTAMLRSAAL
jgi:DNA primase